MSEEIKKAPRGKKTTSPASTGGNSTQNEDNVRELRIEISKYSALDSILGSNKKTLRVLCAVFFMAVLLFFAIFVVTISLKKMYAYSDITTNGLGATTIKSEKNEVSYWLYNTSQLWSNSGITVQRGDIITVRSSGKFNTAIHHLYDAAKENTMLADKWVGSEGEVDNPDVRSSTFKRRQFRMFPNMPTGALVMQVANNNPLDSQADSDEEGKKNFYFIGKERENIYIENSGSLYFSLNDIVLNKRTIIEMLYKCLENDNIKLSKQACFDEPETLFAAFNEQYGKEIEKAAPGERKLGVLKIGITKIKEKNLELPLSKYETDHIVGYEDGDAIVKMCELEYYFYAQPDVGGDNYKTAWFDDNLGSFLIIIEKNSSK